MKNEKIYSIPVTEAFETKCECPVCAMYDKLEQDSVDYAMGPSYMEADIREVTDRVGFCPKHIRMVAAKGNTLGMGLVLKTHFDKVIDDIEALQQNDAKAGAKSKKSLFGKKNESDLIADYIETLEHSCFVCDRVNGTFSRYMDTIFYLWKSNDDFRKLFANTQGFCTAHYRDLRKMAPVALGSDSGAFLEELDKLYIDNMKRVRDDLEKLVRRFDYRYANEPLGSGKDAIPRAVVKINSVTLPENK